MKTLLTATALLAATVAASYAQNVDAEMPVMCTVQPPHISAGTMAKQPEIAAAIMRKEEEKVARNKPFCDAKRQAIIAAHENVHRMQEEQATAQAAENERMKKVVAELQKAREVEQAQAAEAQRIAEIQRRIAEAKLAEARKLAETRAAEERATAETQRLAAEEEKAKHLQWTNRMSAECTRQIMQHQATAACTEEGERWSKELKGKMNDPVWVQNFKDMADKYNWDVGPQ